MATSERRVAILSVHSHGDRSFLDDQRLALLSGDLRARGVENDLVLAVLEPAAQDSAVEERLWETLAAYDVVVYERVFSRDLIARGKARLAPRIFVSCEGEHELADPPADFLCRGDLRKSVPALLAWLAGDRRATPPKSTEGGQAPRDLRGPPAMPVFEPGGVSIRRGAHFEPLDDVTFDRARALEWTPNLHPLVVNPEAFPSRRTFSLTGNEGCPYQADARQNPLYAGIVMPKGVGRGCSFCTTGNFYEARPADVTAASVLGQLRYVRKHAPAIAELVLKDQNPFGYLRALLRGAAAEGLAPFTLLLETRADWFLRSESRFEEALALAAASGISLAPYLVGIESFSQPELDRYNKGITADVNVQFLESLWRWKEKYGAGLNLEHAAFGFVLLSPWTTLDDLEANYDGIVRTRFDRLRGNLLLSRARLYPDTALYYLAEKDGLLTGEFNSSLDDSSLRYGYYPACPWRFREERVARFAAVAAEAIALRGGSDEMTLFRALLDVFASPHGDREVRAADVVASLARPGNDALRSLGPPSAELLTRLRTLVSPLPFDATFACGWRFGELSAAPGVLRVRLAHDREEALDVELVPRGVGAHFAASRHYELRYRNKTLTVLQREALDAFAGALLANDR